MDDLVLCSLTLFRNSRGGYSKGFLVFGPVDMRNRNKVAFSGKIFKHKTKTLRAKKELQPASAVISYFLFLLNSASASAMIGS